MGLRFDGSRAHIYVEDESGRETIGHYERSVNYAEDPTWGNWCRVHTDSPSGECGGSLPCVEHAIEEVARY